MKITKRYKEIDLKHKDMLKKIDSQAKKISQ